MSTNKYTTRTGRLILVNLDILAHFSSFLAILFLFHVKFSLKSSKQSENMQKVVKYDVVFVINITRKTN